MQASNGTAPNTSSLLPPGVSCDIIKGGTVRVSLAAQLSSCPVWTQSRRVKAITFPWLNTASTVLTLSSTSHVFVQAVDTQRS